MERVIFFVYVLLFITTLYLSLINNRKFIVAFYFLLAFAPLAQYFLYPELRATSEGYFDVNFEKALTGLFNIAILIIFIANSSFQNRKKISLHQKNLFFLLGAWIIVNAFSSFLSTYPERSIPLFLISVIGPVMTLSLYNKENLYHKLEAHKIVLILSIFFIVNISIVIGGYFFQIARGKVYFADFNFLKLGGVGVFRSNAGVNMLVFFFPLLFLKFKLSRWENIIFNIGKLLILSTLFTSMMRMGFFVLSLGIVYYMINKQVKIRNIILITTLLMFFIIFLDSLIGDWIYFFLNNRLLGYGYTVTQSAMNDARFLLWNEALTFFIEHPLIGIGMGNYHMFTKLGNQWVSFSSSHDLYINILMERGIFAGIVLLGFIVFFFQENKKLLKILPENSDWYKLINSFKIGMIFYLIISITGEDQYIAGGVLHAFPAYEFFGLIFFQSYFYAYKTKVT